MKLEKTFIIGLIILLVPLLVPYVHAFGLEIESPSHIEYNASIINLSVRSNVTLDLLNYSLDNQLQTLACGNCSEFSKEFNLSNGTHTFGVFGFAGNESAFDSVNFSINLIELNNTPINETNNTTNGSASSPANLTLMITSPKPITYANKTVLLNFSANINSTISYKLDNNSYSSACTQCTEFSNFIVLENGQHNIEVNASSGNLSKLQNVTFSVNQTQIINKTNQTKPPKNNTSNIPRFSKGLNKLPKLVEQGEISDSELAQIIKNNKLNPGILNRLIKTGKLGNESMQAILDSQFNPPGILRKLLNLIGLRQRSYSELMLDNYNLTTFIEQKILIRDDVSIKYVEKIEGNLKKEIKLEIKADNKGEDKVEIKIEEKTKDNKSSVKFEIKDNKEKKTFNAGRQNGKSKDKSELDDSNSKNRKDKDSNGKNKGKSNNGKSNSKGKSNKGNKN